MGTFEVWNVEGADPSDVVEIVKLLKQEIADLPDKEYISGSDPKVNVCIQEDVLFVSVWDAEVPGSPTMKVQFWISKDRKAGCNLFRLGYEKKYSILPDDFVETLLEFLK